MVVDYLSSSPTGLDIRCPPNRGQVQVTNKANTNSTNLPFSLEDYFPLLVQKIRYAAQLCRPSIIQSTHRPALCSMKLGAPATIGHGQGV